MLLLKALFSKPCSKQTYLGPFLFASLALSANLALFPLVSSFLAIPEPFALPGDEMPVRLLDLLVHLESWSKHLFLLHPLLSSFRPQKHYSESRAIAEGATVHAHTRD